MNVTDLTLQLSTDQPLRGGAGGDACPPVGGLGGNDPQSGFFQRTITFRLSQ